MTLGVVSQQGDLLDHVVGFCAVPLDGTVYALLARERENMFPDVLFADLFTGRGRRSVPPSIVATVMVLQRLEGLSDREAVDRFAFDLRWKYAAGVPHDYPSFVHTVLVDFRQRLRDSADQDRIFRISYEIAASAGLIGAKRVLDSAPLFDAVATQDTVTMIRGAIRGVLRVAGSLEKELRGQLERDDDYSKPGKPVCDWDDPQARELMIDQLVHDGLRVLVALDQHELAPELLQAAQLLGVVIGQDIELGEDGIFRILWGTAKDRMISIVDPDARHGHKSSKSGYDGYKGHIALDPDSEIITATSVGPANAGDGQMVEELLDDLTNPTGDATDDHDDDPSGGAPTSKLTVYGDCAYSGGENLDYYEQSGLEIRTRIQPSHNNSGRFGKDLFEINLEAGTVTCPSGITVELAGHATKSRTAHFGTACQSCPLLNSCTTSENGRTISVGPYERQLQGARQRQQDPDWIADYQATRPKVERKIAHLVRRLHGGRKARVRGLDRVNQDWSLKAGAININRLAKLGVRNISGQWVIQPA